MRMSSTVFCAVIFLAALTFSAAQNSCKGRCGAEYYRGYTCQCDYTCLRYEECCKDYESLCTTKNSCKGRCGETFQRGRLCSCDSECVKYKQCCHDYQSNCHAGEAVEQPSTFDDAENNKIVPSDGLSNNGVEDPETGPTPESTSGSGSTVDQLHQVSTEPSLEFSTESVAVTSQAEMTPSKDEPTQADGSSSTLYTASTEGPAESTDASDLVTSTVPGATVPQDTTGSVALASTTVLESSGQTPEDDIFPELQMINSTGSSSHNPDVTSQPVNTVYYSPEASVSTELNLPVLETTQANTTPASATSDLIPSSEPTTSNPEPDDVQNAQHLTTKLPFDRPTDVTTAGSLSVHNVMTTNGPSSTAAVQDDVTPPITSADPAEDTSEMATPQPSEATSKPQDQPDPYKPSPAKPSLAKPTLKPETKPLVPEATLNTDDSRDYQADDSNDTNLCSGRPVSAVTTLKNGTVVVFRGHYFWFLDSNRVPGPARGITQVWGVPSPVDTVFTRCNCQGKTYIFKGPQYWRFENDVLDSGYPKVIQTGFDGLRGHIIAALSIPQYQRRRESVFFFKRGGFVQKYSYQFGSSATCGTTGKYIISTVPKRMARQAVSLLDSAIDIQKSWRGFPSIITAAVSVPNNREPEGYKYYIFSRSKSYNVRMDGEQPVIGPSNAKSPQSNNFFKCPKKV
ncbi:proteoglycan 4b isoform X2 [Channa argus]|uniref:proteoglycan 4b isoform X2 n=1 Tax=Channa argus TaxID=215402 RepID=UPI003521D119